MRLLLHSFVVFASLFTHGGALGADPVRLEDDPGQGIGKKPCGAVWVGYNQPCPGDRVYAPTAPPRPVFVPNMNPDPICLDYPGLNTKEDERTRNEVYVQPSKKEIEKYSVLVNLARAKGLNWGCGLNTIDRFITMHNEGDQCALGAWSGCGAEWNPRGVPMRSGRKDYLGTPPTLAKRIAMLFGLQEELGVPPEMRMRYEDCTEKFLAYYEQFDNYRTNESARAHWSVECMSKGLGMRLAITPQIKLDACDHKGLKRERCLTIEFEADGEKIRVQTHSADAADPLAVMFVRHSMLPRLYCDIRLAKEIAAAPDDPAFRFLTKADIMKLRHTCRVAEAFFASPEVKSFYGGVAAQFDAFAATWPRK